MTYEKAYRDAQKMAREEGFPGCIYYFGDGVFDTCTDGFGELIDMTVPAIGPVQPMDAQGLAVVAYMDKVAA